MTFYVRRFHSVPAALVRQGQARPGWAAVVAMNTSVDAGNWHEAKGPTCRPRPAGPLRGRFRPGRPPRKPAALVLAVLGHQINATMPSPALPDVIERLGTTTAAAGLSQTPFFLMAALGQVTPARLSHRRGRKPMMILCAIVLIAGDLLRVLAPNIGLHRGPDPPGRLGRHVHPRAPHPEPVARSRRLRQGGRHRHRRQRRPRGRRRHRRRPARRRDRLPRHLRPLRADRRRGSARRPPLRPDVPPAATGGRFDSRGIAALSLGLAGVLVGLAQGSTWGWTSPLTLGFLLGGIASLVFFVVSRKFRHRPGDRPRGPGLPPRLAAADHHVLHPRRDRPHHPARRPVPWCGPRSVGRDRCRPLPRPDPAHRSRLGPAGRPDRSEDRLAQGSSSPERPPTSRSSSSRPSSCTTSGS